MESRLGLRICATDCIGLDTVLPSRRRVPVHPWQPRLSSEPHQWEPVELVPQAELSWTCPRPPTSWIGTCRMCQDCSPFCLRLAKPESAQKSLFVEIWAYVQDGLKHRIVGTRGSHTPHSVMLNMTEICFTRGQTHLVEHEIAPKRHTTNDLVQSSTAPPTPLSGAYLLNPLESTSFTRAWYCLPCVSKIARPWIVKRKWSAGLSRVSLAWSSLTLEPNQKCWGGRSIALKRRILMSRKCYLDVFFLQLWNLKTMIHESFVVLDNLDTCSLDFWCIRQAVPNIPTIEIWTAVGVLPSICHDDVRAVCCFPSIPAMTAKEWWCAKMWFPRAETGALLARLPDEQVLLRKSRIESDEMWRRRLHYEWTMEIQHQQWRRPTKGEPQKRNQISAVDSADRSDTAARISDFNHAHNGSAHHVYVQWRAIPNIHGLRPARASCYAHTSAVCSFQDLQLQQPKSDLALKFGRSTTRIFVAGGRHTFPALIVVCFGTFLLRHSDIGNLAPKKTRLVRTPCTPEAQTRVIVIKQVTPSGSRIGNVATRCSFGASRLSEPAFTRDGRARLRPQRAIASTQTAFLLVSLRSRAPWTTRDSVGSMWNLSPNWCHAQLAKALSQV